MSNTIPGASFGPAATRGPDGLAVIGRTLHDLRGIRYDEGEGGGAAPVAPAVPVAPAKQEPQIATEAPVAPKPTAPVVPAAKEPPAKPESAAEKVEDLPAWAQKIITDTRKEAGDARVAKKAEEDRVAAILVAAGIKKDEADPVEVAKKSTAEAEQAKRELAVYKAAANIADPVKLLDRTSFTTSIAGIDPTDGPALLAAVTAAVAADPTLKAVRATAASTVDNSGGTGENGQITEEQLARMTPEQITEALDKGQLKHLL